MVAYCAKGIAGVKHSGALLLDHLMSHQPCHTLHTLHPTPPPPSPPPHPSFLCIHISRYVYTHIRWVYTREGFVYTPKHHLCIHKILGLVYTPKHHLCIHQNIICVYTKSRARCSCVYTYVLCIHKNRVVYTQIFSCVYTAAPQVAYTHSLSRVMPCHRLSTAVQPGRRTRVLQCARAERLLHADCIHLHMQEECEGGST